MNFNESKSVWARKLAREKSNLSAARSIERDARALAHRLGLIEPGPHGEMVLKESAVRAIQAFGLRQQAEGMREAAKAVPDGKIGAVWKRSMLDLATRLEAQAKEIEG